MTASTKVERDFFPLIDAVEAGSVERVRAALAAGADITQRLSTGHTALSKATARDSAEIVDILLSAAAEAKCAPEWFDLALVMAAGRKRGPLGAKYTEQLLEAGASPDARTVNCTALQGAVYAHNVETARLLLAAGADPDGIAEGFNLVPLVIAMGMCGRMHDDEDAVNATVELVEMLARAGADAGYVPPRGWAAPEQGFLTPYQYAMSKERFDIVRMLSILAGQDPRQSTVDGKTMLDIYPNKLTKKRAAAAEFLFSLATEMDVHAATGGVGEDARPARVVQPAL